MKCRYEWPFIKKTSTCTINLIIEHQSVRVGLKRENYGRGRWTQTQLPEAMTNRKQKTMTGQRVRGTLKTKYTDTNDMTRNR